LTNKFLWKSEQTAYLNFEIIKPTKSNIMKLKLYHRFIMLFTTLIMFAFIANSQTTISVPIIDAHDDAEEGLDPDPDGNLPLNGIELESGDLEMCTEAENYRQIVGMIFRDIQIPIGATITNAYVQFYCDDTNDEEITIDIQGAKEANAPAPFTDTPGSISAHERTDAKVEWTPVPWTEAMLLQAGEEQKTPDIKSVIQEIIEIPGWAPGNNVMILVTDLDNPVKSHRQAVTFDEDPTKVAVLNVTFTTGTSIDPLRSGMSGIYPNPTEGILNINNPSSDNFSYEIYTITGKLVASRNNLTGSTIQIDLSNYARGAYFVNVRTAQITERHKLILN
jgi:hypothetical protein